MQDSFIQYQFAAQQLRNGFARQVIFGGPEAAARQNQRNALERVAKRLRQQFAIVAHNRLADDFDSQLVQFFGEIERVGIHAVRSQQFRTHRDDLGFHQFDNPTSGRPRTSQSSVKSAPVVAKIARPEDCSAIPTSPDPLSAMSACP